MFFKIQMNCKPSLKVDAHTTQHTPQTHLKILDDEVKVAVELVAANETPPAPTLSTLLAEPANAPLE